MDRKTMHSVFDSVGQLHSQIVAPEGARVVGAIQRAEDPDLTQAESDEMGNVAELESLDSDLARAKKISEIGGSAEVTKDLGDNTIGSQVIITDTNTGNPPGPADLQGTDIKALFTIQIDNGKSEVMTVSLNTPNKIGQTGGAQGKNYVVAILEYGAGGSQNRVEIDWATGSSFQIEGSYFRLSARVDHVTGTPGDQWQVGAFVCKGSKTRNSKLIRSVHIGALLHGNSSTSLVPANATEVQFAYDTVNEVELSSCVIVAENRDIAAVSRMYQRDIEKNENPLPIVSMVTIMEYFNNDAAVDIHDSWAMFTIEP
jgi:hypothetical protein